MTKQFFLAITLFSNCCFAIKKKTAVETGKISVPERLSILEARVRKLERRLRQLETPNPSQESQLDTQ